MHLHVTQGLRFRRSLQPTQVTRKQWIHYRARVQKQSGTARQTAARAEEPESEPTGASQEAQPQSDQEVFGSVDIRNNIDDKDIVPILNLRDKLEVRLSPLASENYNIMAGLVGDRDLVSMHALSLDMECADEFGERVVEDGSMRTKEPWAVRAGPRRHIYWDPLETTAAIVTCGGLCPGLNDVIQAVVQTLRDYGVPEDQVCGIRYGLRGFYEKDFKPVNLEDSMVDSIHLKGGTILGTSRGGADIDAIVQRLRLWGVNMVFVIGGNGGNKAAHAIHVGCVNAGWTASVVALPKSIDNDILIIDKCFGFETAVDEAQRALMAAHVEARSAQRGIGVVRLMGRESGFIAMDASMSSGVVDICLIPELTFSPEALYEHVRRLLDRNGHCVVCIAEGAGQAEFEPQGKTLEYDKSGNPKLRDTGRELVRGLKAYFGKRGENADIKYIDPSYMIRSTATIPADRVYCNVLGANAVHGAFAGYTDITVGLVNTHYVYLPIQQLVAKPRKVNPRGVQWSRLMASIQQPDLRSPRELAEV